MKDGLYDAAFYAQHGVWKGDYVRVASWLLASLDFESACDLGCGSGLVLSEMLKAGKKVWGVDGSPDAITAADPALRPFLAVVDLEKPFCFKADLVVCMEVAEHLEEKFADTLVGSLVESADRWIYLTAATPGQGGLDHVNEQPHSYWVEKLRAKGFELVPGLTAKIRTYLIGIAAKWFQQNSMIFKRR